MKRQPTVRPVGYTVHYEYIGFEYQITKEASGWIARALPGQHRAATKQKHLWAAVESYRQEYNES